MNVLVIVPTAVAGAEAARYWKARTMQRDRLYMLSLFGSKAECEHGLDIHHLEVDLTKPRSWHSRVVRTVGRWLAFIRPLWNLILFDFWPDLFWNVRSFDPD